MSKDNYNYRKMENGKEKKFIKCMNYGVCKTEFWSEGNHNRLCNICGKVRSKATYSIGY